MLKVVFDNFVNRNVVVIWNVMIVRFIIKGKV